MKSDVMMLDLFGRGYVPPAERPSVYGMPYQGSKSQIAEWVIAQLPEGGSLYDLFGGGGALSHCAALSGKWDEVHYNEFDAPIAELFARVIRGELPDDAERWVSHEEFFALRDSDALVSLLWSFGNNRRSYLYNRKIEEMTRIAHNAAVTGEMAEIHRYLPDLRFTADMGVYQRKGAICREAKRVAPLSPLNCNPSMERLERMRRLAHSLRHLSLNAGSIHTTALSYDQLSFPPNSILLCDPPYANTTKYCSAAFDHEAFYSWCAQQAAPLYICEYAMPTDRFRRIAVREKRSLMNDANNSTFKPEGLWRPLHQL